MPTRFAIPCVLVASLVVMAPRGEVDLSSPTLKDALARMAAEAESQKSPNSLNRAVGLLQVARSLRTLGDGGDADRLRRLAIIDVEASRDCDQKVWLGRDRFAAHDAARAVPAEPCGTMSQVAGARPKI